MVQGQSSGQPDHRGTDSDHPATNGSPRVSEAAVREELTRILAGHEFRSSKRSQDFLRYVVENTLCGHAGILKERTIGVEVFGRPPSYDPGEDATVRVKAGEVRKRLGLYYAGEGLRNPLRVELPAGSYVPEFRLNAPAIAAAAVTSSHSVAPLPLNNRLGLWKRRRSWFIAAGALLVLASGGLWGWNREAAPRGALDEFWAPVLQSKQPVSVCAAYVPVYWPDREDIPKDQLRVQNFTLLNDQFVGGGDLIAVSRLTSMLTRRRRLYDVRIGNEITLRDLKAGPAIMVGYSYTRWRDISSDLRYFIDASRTPIGITDNGAPTQWALPHLPPDRHTREDYAIVTRVVHPDTHSLLVEIAGITQYGTDAASDMVTNAGLMTEALRGAPAGWSKKNLQLVLHVKVISGAPSSPQVLARYVW